MIKRTSSCLVFLLIGLSISLVWAVTMSHPAHLNWSPWAYSEWLISYDAGFIRRGMGGELIQLVKNGDHVSVVNVLVFANYVALSLLMLWAWRRSPTRSPAAMVLAVLVPGGLFQMAIGNAFFFRKEIVFHIALGIDCVLYSLLTTSQSERRREALAAILMALFALQCVLLPLVHESYLFISFPAAWLIANRTAALCPQQKLYRRIVEASIGLEIVLFGLCAVFKGSPDIVNQMWHLMSAPDRSWISQGTDALPTGGISAIGWSTLFNLSGVLQMFLAGEFWIWALAATGIGAVLTLVTVWNGQQGAADAASRSATYRAHMAQLTFLFLASSPMYVLGIDWGRWLSALTISYLLILFIDSQAAVTPPDLLRAVPAQWRKRIADAFDFTSRDVAQSVVRVVTKRRAACLLLALFFCLTFRSPECCMKVGSPFYRLKPMVQQLLNK